MLVPSWLLQAAVQERATHCADAIKQWPAARVEARDEIPRELRRFAARQIRNTLSRPLLAHAQHECVPQDEQHTVQAFAHRYLHRSSNAPDVLGRRA